MSDKESVTDIERARRVRDMFAGIAARYDLLNHVLSGNIDKRWRRTVAGAVNEALPVERKRVLDVACGTGDLAFALCETSGTEVVGLDFCRPMLTLAAEKAAKKQGQVPFVEGDALKLPFSDRSFDAVTIAFGLRNLSSIELGFKELFRVLQPGGLVAVLEFSRPKTPVLRSFFKVYFTRVLPFLGGLISGSRGAYEYLPDSVSRFPDQENLAGTMKQVGFEQVTFENLTGGIAALHLGRRPNY